MKILRKHNNTVEILALPGDADLERGEFLLASEDSRSLLLQVIDMEYADIPGVLEDLLREVSIESMGETRLFDPFNISSLTMIIRDSRIILTKIRAVIENGRLSMGKIWMPSRFTARLEKVSVNTVLSMLGGRPNIPILVGKTCDEEFYIDAMELEGKLTIITGKKESGKSHLAKILSTELAINGGRVVVLDINGEYVNLGRYRFGKRHPIGEKIVVLEPAKNFRVGISDVDLSVLLDILDHVYGTPITSLREFARIWNTLKSRGTVSLHELINAVGRFQMNEAVREALLSRLMSLINSGFFVDDEGDGLTDIFLDHKDGLLLVIDLSRVAPHLRRVVVEYLLSRLNALLFSGTIQPVFLFAEEAHLYLRNTYWEDIVTRMRHIGISPVFITNQPDTIPEMIYRQADNIFLFNFTNDADLEAIAKYSHVDSDTIKKISPSLQRGQAMVIGRVAYGVPVILNVKDSELDMRGETKLFFKARQTNY